MKQESSSDLEIYNKLCNHAKDMAGIDIRYVRRRRHAEIIRIRACIMVIMIRYYRISTVSIGRLMQRDHATVVHHHGNHSSRYQSEEEYYNLYTLLCGFVERVAPVEFELDEVNTYIKAIAP